MGNGDDDDVRRIPPVNRRGGDWVRIGLDEYRIPPLGFLQVQELQDDVRQLATMTARPTPEQMQVVARIVHAAMSRNYPDLPLDEVAAMLDIGNYQTILAAVLQIAGFRREVGAGPEGEVRASTGVTSTSP